MFKKNENKRISRVKIVERIVTLFFLFSKKNSFSEINKIDKQNNLYQDQFVEKKSNTEKGQSFQTNTTQTSKFLAISKAVELYANILGEIGKMYFYNYNFEEINTKVLQALQETMDKGTEISFRSESLFNKVNEIESSLCLGFEIEQRSSIQMQRDLGEKEKKEWRKNFNKAIVCTKIYRDSPASKNGLQKGDLIIKIGNQEILNRNEEETINIIRKVSLPFDITVVKMTGEVKRIFFGKEKTKVKNIVFADVLEGEIGYIKLAEFGKGVGQEFKQVVSNLKSLGASKLLIDLRGNSGGFVEELVQVLEQLIEPETLLLKTALRSGEVQKSYKTKGEIFDTRTPIIVLIDQETASSAELFAGILQDLDRAVLIGKNSFGKGTIQVVKELPYGYSIKMTTSRYILPSGRYVLDDVANRPSKPFKARQFRTKKGRIVYEMKGITPDIILTEKSFSPIVNEALKNGAFDQYAREFLSKKEVKNIKDFYLTEAQLTDAISWMAKHSEFYRHEQEVDKLFNMLNEYDYVDLVKANQQKIKLQMQKTRIAKLQEVKQEVKDLLERAIIENKFLYEGLIEYTLKRDTKIQRAVYIFKKMEEYERMLST